MPCLTPKPITNEHDGHLQGWEDCGRCRYCLSFQSTRPARGATLGESLVAAVNDPEVKAAMEAEKP